MADDQLPQTPTPPPPAPPPPAPPRSPLLESIDQAGIRAGLDTARVDHPAELALEASTAEGGTVKLSMSGRWHFLKAAVFGRYSKDRGGTAGGEVVVPLGHRPILTDDPYPQASPLPTSPDPRFPER